MNEERHGWVAIARVLRPRGNKGEVAVELLTDFPQRLTGLPRVFLARPREKPRARDVVSCWLSQNRKGQAVFHFAGIDSISRAEELRGMEVLLPLEERIRLPAGQYFVSDLIGCAVFEHSVERQACASSPCSLESAPSYLGKVADVEFVGEDVSGTPILHVEMGRGELLIPLAEDICFGIQVGARRIDVVLPEGLRGLNEPE